ncbi:MAG: hypothetical protein VX874_12380 [Pseudomonadota bacterium]|nr:hypothetical protein [Pseudomonadota bacterium]
MTRISLGLIALMLAACGASGNSGDLPQYFSVAEAPYPPEVLSALPADIPYSDILARLRPGELGACYFYRRDGEIYPLTEARNQGTEYANYPYCVQ